ncbi:MAG: hypothetical protein JNM01_10210 [Delftia acidovorans]|uniref:Uncharacterized protein n=1 Tax=Delftia acidovorans TaxID=80866 RepID=A0A7T2S9V1_DELAC|nr:hypothetical protein [Delftia acidovorans]MBL8355194.1 hypothetical protein [Delftia acidovorans]QPS11609.1 hypothetical protein I6G66_04230 [Delftia acidovorans]
MNGKEIGNKNYDNDGVFNSGANSTHMIDPETWVEECTLRTGSLAPIRIFLF